MLQPQTSTWNPCAKISGLYMVVLPRTPDAKKLLVEEIGHQPEWLGCKLCSRLRQLRAFAVSTRAEIWLK